LGLHFLEQYQYKLNISTWSLHFQSDGGTVPITNKSTTANACTSKALIMVTMSETRLVSTNSDLEVVGKVVNNKNGVTCLLDRAGNKAFVARGLEQL